MGAISSPEDDALIRSSTVVSDDRADRLSMFMPPASATSPQAPSGGAIGSTSARSASFDVGGFTLELVAVADAVTLTVVAGPDRDTYPLEPTSLDHWADATARLLGLSAAQGLSACADFRAPFLLDVGKRASIAFESAVTEGGVAHRLLLMRDGGRVAAVATSAGVLGELIDAARGAAAFAGSSGSNSR
jgi:hypothetical protein